MAELTKEENEIYLAGVARLRMAQKAEAEGKGMKKREIQRLDYGALLKYKEEVGARKYPARGCISWRQTGACDPVRRGRGRGCLGLH